MSLGLRSVVVHITAVVSAVSRSVKYGPTVGIRHGEWSRYLQKSINFALCYAGFAPRGSLYQASLVGKAAFLCCAYDVVTDWRSFGPTARRGYEDVLRRTHVEPELRELATGLYEKESRCALLHDGLERGSIALRFTLRMAGCEEDREETWGDLDEIGRLLQIVDDVLDYEHDLVRGETNCLASDSREVHLKALLRGLGDGQARDLFGAGAVVLVKVVEMAERKAMRLLQ